MSKVHTEQAASRDCLGTMNQSMKMLLKTVGSGRVAQCFSSMLRVCKMECIIAHTPPKKTVERFAGRNGVCEICSESR